jgi:hypothetical protein
MFASIGSALSGMMHGISDLAGKTWDFVKQHANVIAKIGDALSVVGTVLSVAAAATAEIPIVGEVVEGVSIGVNAEALGAHALAKAAGAKVSDATLAMDAISMVPGGTMLKSMKTLKVAKQLVSSTAKAVRYADDGAKIAKGMDAAGTVLERAGTRQLGSWANGAKTLAKWVPGLPERTIEKIGVTPIKIGDETVHVATNTVGRVAGAVVGGVEKGTVKVLEDRYESNAEDAAKNVAAQALHGQPLPSAGQVFHQVLSGRSSW